MCQAFLKCVARKILDTGRTLILLSSCIYLVSLASQNALTMKNIFGSIRKRALQENLSSDELGRVLTHDEETFLAGLTEIVLPWLRDVAYSHGVNRGLHAKKKENYITNIDSRLNDSRLSWTWHHNWLRVVVNSDERLKRRWEIEVTAGTELFVLQPRGFSSDFVIFVARYVEQIANKFFDKARFVNRVTHCQAIGHLDSQKEQMFSICIPLADQWVCDLCVERLAKLETEAASHDNPKTATQIERDKVSGTLRYQILLRDGFTCRACGHSPLKGDDIKLHVDHILPISKGGKTEPKNLCVLCQDCNFGKRDLVIAKEVRAAFARKG